MPRASETTPRAASQSSSDTAKDGAAICPRAADLVPSESSAVYCHVVFSLHFCTFLLLLFCLALVVGADEMSGSNGLKSETQDHVLSIDHFVQHMKVLHVDDPFRHPVAFTSMRTMAVDANRQQPCFYTLRAHQKTTFKAKKSPMTPAARNLGVRYQTCWEATSG
jgi:hypothetical protein